MSRLRIVVMGYMVRFPVGGLAWRYAQYLLGFKDLGHDVYYIEDSGDDALGCYDPSTYVSSSDPSYGLAFTQSFLDRLGAGDRWAYFDAHTATWRGPRSDDGESIVRSADILINVDTVNALREWSSAPERRVAIDGDPAFGQIWNLTDPVRRSLVAAHTHHLTAAEAIHDPASSVPDDGFDWQPTRQPVVLEWWPAQPPAPDRPLTTVMQWRSYDEQLYDGRIYGLKERAFEPYFPLPERTRERMEVALGGGKKVRTRLHSHGWTVRDSLLVSRDPWTYREYIQTSKAEFSVAKHGYVVTRCGWFGERSLAYLSSGRPVVMQDTGLGDWGRGGKGLLLFSTLDEAVERLDELSASYEDHAKAARKIVESRFEAGQVLTELLDDLA